MKPVFADTSYFIALLNEEDDYHEVALALSDTFLGRTIVTEYVLVELGNALSRSKRRDRYSPLVRHLLTDTDTDFVPASVTLFRQGRHLFKTRVDKTWSMVDCLSFIVMKQRRLVDAFTTDQHFIQDGFRAPLRERSSRRPGASGAPS